MIKVNHSWEMQPEFREDYIKHIQSKLSEIMDENKSNNIFFDIINNEENLKTLLFNSMDTLREDENFKPFWELCDFYVLCSTYSDYKTPSDYKGIQRKESELYRKRLLEEIKDYCKNSADEKLNIHLMNDNETVKKIKVELTKVKKHIKNKHFKLIENIINYDYIKNDYRDEILNSINIAVCPYCNRNYTDKFYDSVQAKDRNLGYLDHFYSKDIYPFLALSLYNFVPSCNTCNSKFKLAQSKNIIYPYSEEFGDDCKFVLEHKSPLSVIGLEAIDIIDLKIKENAFLKDKMQASINLFRIKDIYKNHENEVKEILLKHQCYNSDMKSYLLEMLKDNKPIYNEENIDEFIFGLPSVDEIQNTPLGKFKRDIYDYIRD